MQNVKYRLKSETEKKSEMDSQKSDHTHKRDRCCAALGSQLTAQEQESKPGI